MIKKFQNHILGEPWETRFIRKMRKVEICVFWPVIVIAVIYFAPVLVRMIARMP